MSKSCRPNKYRFVSDADSWDHILEIYRRGSKKPIAKFCYGNSNELATQLSELFAKMPELLPSCTGFVAALIADLKSGDPEEMRFRRRFDCRLLAGFEKALIDTVRRGGMSDPEQMLESLSDKLNAYCDANGLEHLSADELLCEQYSIEPRNKEHIAFLEAFIEEWDAFSNHHTL
jgi:hypothetical protein